MQTVTTTVQPTDTTLTAAQSLVETIRAANPTLTDDQVAALFTEVHAKIVEIAQASVPLVAAPAEPAAPAVPPRPEAPAVAVEDSVSADGEWIFCLEDGSRHKMMKRYLRRKFNLTPEEYRARWDLPADYPMTAPAYSDQKRGEARTVGLGTKANKAGYNLSLVAA